MEGEGGQHKAEEKGAPAKRRLAPMYMVVAAGIRLETGVPRVL